MAVRSLAQIPHVNNLRRLRITSVILWYRSEIRHHGVLIVCAFWPIFITFTYSLFINLQCLCASIFVDSISIIHAWNWLRIAFDSIRYWHLSYSKWHCSVCSMDNTWSTLSTSCYFLLLETNTIDAVEKFLDVIALVKSIHHCSHICDFIS